MKDQIIKRDIKNLLHFTDKRNLKSILNKGLIPRKTLESDQVHFFYVDKDRFDGAPDANCLSLSHPNYKFFYSTRINDQSRDWVIINIKPEILYIKNCAFCYDNAANIKIKSIPIAERKGILAFQNMFPDSIEGKSRLDLEIPDCYPTNPQAEILVFDIIEPKYIQGIITDTKELAEELKYKYPNFSFNNQSEFYQPRKDYRHWINGY